MADLEIGNPHGVQEVSGNNRSGALDNDNLDTIETMKTRLASVSGTNAIIQVTQDGTGGTFTLTHEGDTTGTIAFDANAATIKSALETLNGIDEVTVVGSADDFTVEFTGAAVLGQPQTLTGDGASLTGGSEGLVITDSVVGITYYDTDRLNSLSYNDLVYAIRLADGDGIR